MSTGTTLRRRIVWNPSTDVELKTVHSGRTEKYDRERLYVFRNGKWKKRSEIQHRKPFRYAD